MFFFFLPLWPALAGPAGSASMAANLRSAGPFPGVGA